MKILSFSLTNKISEWTLNETNLNKFTLLVGASGVGKTQILRSLVTLKKIALGGSLNGIAWKIKFETDNNNIFLWEGEFETKNDFFNENNESRFIILSEKLFLNENQIIERIKGDIFFKKNKTVKLSNTESAIYLLKEEDEVKPAYENIQKIHFSDQLGFADDKGIDLDDIDEALIAKYNSVKKIQESDFRTSSKLFLLSIIDTDFFEKIKNRFIEIFPTIEDIGFSIKVNNDIFGETTKTFSIKIKEKGVLKWIEFPNISWGMVRTLKHLSEIYLCAEGTVFLIDEFENSLGINCINEIINDILKSRRQLQFILTSHHPYIINSINYSDWKLVTRNANIIKTHNVEKFHIGKSKHDAFMQLIQLEEYQTGTEQL